jgi:hypothetical protein
VGLKTNGTHQLLLYADDVNLLEDNMNTIRSNTEAPTDTTTGVVLEINRGKNKYMLMSHHQNVGQNYNTKTAIRSFIKVANINAWERQYKIKEQIKFGQCLLLFNLEPFVFLTALKKRKD